MNSEVRLAISTDAPKLLELKKLQMIETEGVDTFDDEKVL